MSAKVLIYGIGNNFIRYYQWLKENYDVKALVDRSEEKVGTEWDGILVKGIDAVTNFEYEKIIITPNCAEDIIADIERYSVSRNKIMTLDEALNNTLDKRYFNLAFYISGGLGDLLIALNYIDAFKTRFCNTMIQYHLFCQRNAEVIKQLSIDFKTIYNESDSYRLRSIYDAVIEIGRYPYIAKFDECKIIKQAPELMEYICLCKDFYGKHYHFIDESPKVDALSAQYELINGRKRIQQPDIFDYFKINETFRNCLINNDVSEWKNRKYITIHRGVDKKHYTQTNVKLWETDNYEKLIILLKKKYSNYEIVLVGEEYERTAQIKSQDIDLLGKTTVLELADILKNSSLHVDTEGGLVHLRHAVHGGVSVVLFGPTSPEFYGYEENINIRTEECAMTCEWINRKWTTRCINEKRPNICMKSITPESVIEAIDQTDVL